MVLNEHPATVRSLSICSKRCSGAGLASDRDARGRCRRRGHRRAGEPDTDRILRASRRWFRLTLRTTTGHARFGPQAVMYWALKLNAQLIDELLLPRPRYEIFAYSPRVEGVHLRFGPVARGGLVLARLPRRSNRDSRLVKAQR